MELVIVESCGLTVALYGISECTFHIRNTLEHRLFGESPVERHTFRCSPLQADSIINTFDPHWVIFGGEPSLTRQNRGCPRLDLPISLCLYIDTSDKESTRQRVSKRLLRKIRQSTKQLSITVQTCRDDADFNYFFEEMHQPFMQKRHGIRARTASKESAYQTLHEWDNGYMVKVFSEEKWVAGMLMPVDEKSKTAYCRFMGILHADEVMYRAGVAPIMHNHAVEWALEHGMERLHLGGTYPFIDGIFKAKKNLGCRLYRPREGFMSELGGYEMSFHFHRGHPLIRKFLLSQPLVVLDEAGEPFIMGFHTPDEPFMPDYPNSTFEKIVPQDINTFI